LIGATKTETFAARSLHLTHFKPLEMQQQHLHEPMMSVGKYIECQFVHRRRLFDAQSLHGIN
jgi:hypothetical protein